MTDFLAPVGALAGPGPRSYMRTDDIAGAQPRRRGFQRSQHTEQLLGLASPHK